MEISVNLSTIMDDILKVLLKSLKKLKGKVFRVLHFTLDLNYFGVVLYQAHETFDREIFYCYLLLPSVFLASHNIFKRLKQLYYSYHTWILN